MITIKKRLTRYEDYITTKPKMKNQLVVQDGKGVLFIEGRKHECELLEGFIKFPEDKYVERIDTQNIIICVLPKKRLLVARNDEWYMGGYKKENSSDCLLVVHAVTEDEEIFIVWIADNDTPICIMIGDSELAEDSIGTIMMKIIQYMMFSGVSGKLEVHESVCGEEGGEIDELE